MNQFFNGIKGLAEKKKKKIFFESNKKLKIGAKSGSFGIRKPSNKTIPDLPDPQLN
jgi:hypothetical protein